MVVVGVIVFIGLFLLFYIFTIRPKQLTWGAEKEEVDSTMPGDIIVQNPNFNATRGITISAPKDEIWKWIIQIGSTKAGWYSIDWIDNGGQKSSEVIIPEFQNIEIGQFIPFTPDGKNGMWVEDFKPNDFILWIDKKGKATWLWHLYENSEKEIRLITRLRTRYDWKSIWIIYYLIYDVGDIIMMRKCMKGIKHRAEKR